MTTPWIGIAAVLVTLSGLMAGLKMVAGRVTIDPEVSRKAVHIVMGLVTLSFPWIFRERWPVLLLALLAVAALAGTRWFTPLRNQFGGVLNGVARQSLGELMFPIAVAILFILAEDRLLYVVPLLTLTLADAVAALVGVRYGTTRYQTSEGSKSAEGSLAFFFVAFLSALVPLLLMGNTGTASSLLIALVLGILVMLFEAISVGGMDNLFIPLGCYGLLKRYLPMQPDELLFRLGTICILALLVYLWRRRTTLKDSALLAATLVGYMNWALGGFGWLAVSLFLFLTYTWLWPKTTDNAQPVHTVRVVAAVAGPGMIWLLALLETSRAECFYPFVLCYAAFTMIIGITQLGYAAPRQPVPRLVATALFRSWLAFLPLFFLPLLGLGSAFQVLPALKGAVAALPLMAAAATIFLLFRPLLGYDQACRRRWFGQAVIVLVVSLAEAAIVLPLS